MQMGLFEVIGRLRSKSLTLAGIVIGAAVICMAAKAGSAESTVAVDYRVFPGFATMDGNWEALLAASDGKVYVGLACHGCSGHLIYFYSKANRMVDVGDLNTR
jgi:hypothetical protein